MDGYLDATGWQIKRGRFISALDQELGSDACIIGADIEDAFFKDQDPLGQPLRIGANMRCTVVGTFMRKGNAFGQSQDLRVVIPLSAFMRTFGVKRGLSIAVSCATGFPRRVMRTTRQLCAAPPTIRDPALHWPHPTGAKPCPNPSSR